MSTGEIRVSDATRVCFEFQDSSFMDSRQIMYEASPAKKVNHRRGLNPRRSEYTDSVLSYGGYVNN